MRKRWFLISIMVIVLAMAAVIAVSLSGRAVKDKQPELGEGQEIATYDPENGPESPVNTPLPSDDSETDPEDLADDEEDEDWDEDEEWDEEEEDEDEEEEPEVEIADDYTLTENFTADDIVDEITTPVKPNLDANIEESDPGILTLYIDGEPFPFASLTAEVLEEVGGFHIDGDVLYVEAGGFTNQTFVAEDENGDERSITFTAYNPYSAPTYTNVCPFNGVTFTEEAGEGVAMGEGEKELKIGGTLDRFIASVGDAYRKSETKDGGMNYLWLGISCNLRVQTGKDGKIERIAYVSRVE